MKIIQKIREYLNYVLGLVLLVLSALLFRKRMQNEELKSEIAREKTNDEIKDNERDRLAARKHAGQLVDEYERSKRDD